MSDLHIPLTVIEATQALTGREVIAIEEHFRAPMNKMSGVKMLIGLAWAHRRRNETEGGKPGIAWADAEEMTLQDLEEYFESEPDGLDEDAEGNSSTA